jgi:hypothetical protein
MHHMLAKRRIANCPRECICPRGRSIPLIKHSNRRLKEEIIVLLSSTVCLSTLIDDSSRRRDVVCLISERWFGRMPALEECSGR